MSNNLTIKNERPLISLIVRTMNRPKLPEALGCIQKQTYPNIEIIIVDAKGENLLDIHEVSGKFPVRIVSKNKHLNIPVAANTGLDEVKGEFFGFLDEDDLIDENHIDDLFQLLNKSDDVAAYSNINMVDKDGNLMKIFDEEYRHERLLYGNFIPIHALLFRSNVLEKGCRSDESLKILDDWDFLLQVAQHGQFLHLDKTTGTYRNLLSSGAQHNEELITSFRKLILAKWRDIISPDLYYSFINYIGNLNRQMELDELKQSIAKLEKMYAEEKQSVAKFERMYAEEKQSVAKFERMYAEEKQSVAKFEKMYAEEKQKNQQLMLDLDQALNTIKAIEKSKSWRITAPFRKLMESIGS